MMVEHARFVSTCGLSFPVEFINGRPFLRLQGRYKPIQNCGTGYYFDFVYRDFGHARYFGTLRVKAGSRKV